MNKSTSSSGLITIWITLKITENSLWKVHKSKLPTIGEKEQHAEEKEKKPMPPNNSSRVNTATPPKSSHI
jgi:hypothetical protein